MTLHRRGSHPSVVTWAQLVALPADDCGPYQLPSGLLVARDPRLVGYAASESWVPARLVRPGTDWTLRTQWHYSTFNPAALPAGWSATFGGGGGTITGGLGAQVVVEATAVAGSVVYLGYVLGAAGGTNEAVIVTKAYAGENRYRSSILLNFNNLSSQYGYNEGGYRRAFWVTPVTQVIKVAFTSIHPHWICVQKPNTGASIVIVPDVNGTEDAWAGASWGAAVGNEAVSICVQHGGGANPATQYLDNFAIYTR